MQFGYTLCSVIMLAGWWGIRSQSWVPTFRTLAAAFLAGAVGFTGVRLWAGGLHRWLGGVVSAGVERVPGPSQVDPTPVLAAVAVVLLVASAAVVPFAALTSQEASAVAAVIDDFEDGDTAEWSGSITTTTTNPAGGTYAGTLPTDSGGTLTFSEQTGIDTFSFAHRHDAFPSQTYRFVTLHGNGGANSNAVRLKTQSDGTLVVQEGGDTVTDTVTTFTPQTGKWYYYQIFNIGSFDDQSFGLRVVTLDGETVYEKTGFSFQGGSQTSVDTLEIQEYNGQDIYIDSIRTDTKVTGPSTSVTGTVTDASSTNLRGVSLTLKDASGTTVATTETNTNGDYAIPIGAGDYTLTADAPGYQPTTRSVSIDGSSRTVDLTLREGFPKQIRLNDTADKFDDPRLVVFEYTAADIRQLEGGPYSQPAVWTVTDTYQFEDNQAEPNLVAGTQYAFRVVETGTGTTGGTAVVEEYPYYAQDDGRAVTIDVPGVEGNDTVTTRQTDAGTQVTYDGPAVEEFSYELPSGYNETLSFDEPRDYYSTTVGENATNGTQSDGGQLEYSGTYANGTEFNGSSIYDSSALTFGPVGGSGGGGGGGASTTVALGLIATAALAGYARYGNGEVGRALAQVSTLLGRVLP
jgi:hypothetical protein